VMPAVRGRVVLLSEYILWQGSLLFKEDGQLADSQDTAIFDMRQPKLIRASMIRRLIVGLLASSCTPSDA
jgi:hypothetical protein